MIYLILARADNGVIGAKGALPWRLPEDMRRFKALTMGKPCIMGRKTWESLPKKPLPGRTNIVVTRSRAFATEGAVVVHSFDEALAQVYHRSCDFLREDQNWRYFDYDWDNRGDWTVKYKDDDAQRRYMQRERQRARAQKKAA